MKSYSVTIQMKATEQYFPVVLFIMLYKVILTFESVYNLNQSFRAVRSSDAIFDILKWYFFVSILTILVSNRV